MMSEFPELDKYAAVREQFEGVAGFLEAMGDKSIVLCHSSYSQHDGTYYSPVGDTMSAVADHFGINWPELQRERDELVSRYVEAKAEQQRRAR